MPRSPRSVPQAGIDLLHLAAHRSELGPEHPHAIDNILSIGVLQASSPASRVPGASDSLPNRSTRASTAAHPAHPGRREAAANQTNEHTTARSEAGRTEPPPNPGRATA